ncbi:GDSL-type esterase/lipase family protein [Amycolatopsis sp. RTGN1]|uniref:GDSL-type esterase/lipase family protein n=1 Tax=Amycolatopsis ponsaeliensis TaxID=2992142 RepID=UPI00254AAC9B|nr:GDSL-type esterase/lipase family protein [Amycolatopsis sp. RTGN1]
MRWQATWTQAMTDFRGDDEEPPFADVAVRMTVPASIGGSHVRAELSNRFGDEPVLIGHGAIGVGDQSLDITFDGQRSVEIPAGESWWTDPVELTVGRSDHVVVDLYLPEPTPYATANGFRFQRATAPGDVVGSRQFPAAETGLAAEGTGWSLPSGGPFLRAVEVAGTEAAAVIVCLGASITTMGWPQLAAAMLPADARIAVLNRGIPGNRLRHDAPPAHPPWGRSGLSRFDEDVLGTTGVTHVVLAHAGNDIGLPGEHAPIGELPTAAQQIDAYRQLIDRATAAGLGVALATITPIAPGQGDDREPIRTAVNDWIRASGHEFADFDAVLRSAAVPSRMAAEYDAGDHQHPNVTGENLLARAMSETITRLLR